MKNLKTNKEGFTLIELILYIAIISIILVGFMTFSLDVIYSGEKSEIRQTVQQNAIFSMQKILKEIRTSNDLNIGSSTFDTSPGVLSLSKNLAGDDPTIFDISSGNLQIQQGTNGPYALTDDNLEVTNLVFTNQSVSNRTTIVGVELTLRHINADQSNLTNAQISLHGAAVIRERSD